MAEQRCTAERTAAERAFTTRFPGFDPDGSFAALHRREYGRLDATGQVYLDYTGGGLHAESQVDAHAELLRSRVLGNPHSNNPTSAVATELVERARAAVLSFVGARADEYLCAFTANATGALKLVGEAYPFERGGTFALTADNHNSVNGIREFARRRGACVRYVPVVAPELRVDRAAMADVLAGADPTARNLFAFPAQSNFSGVQHPLALVDEAHDARWDVLLDAAAFMPTNRLDLGRVRPEFVALSFYKIFGFPTGAGFLLIRRDRAGALVRPWFAGGTVTIASVRGDGHYLRPDAAAFEDGTVDYLNLPAVERGLRHVDAVGIDAIHHRVECPTAWLLDAMAGLRHRDGARLVHVLGPTDTTERGGAVTFVVRDREGNAVCERHIETLANRTGISLRTGCFCNPGASEIAHGLARDELAPLFGRDAPVWPADLGAELAPEQGRTMAAVRVSVGLASDFSDVHQLVGFLRGFLDRSAADVERAAAIGGR